MTESSDFVTAPVRVVETHISVLLFFGDKVYKIHKPVHFDFLDFRDRTRSRRGLPPRGRAQSPVGPRRVPRGGRPRDGW